MRKIVNVITRRVQKNIINKFLRKRAEKFLNEISGIIHVGANIGQERDLYKNYNLDVIWVEPIPSIFEQLENNIKGYDKQKAFQALITNEENKAFEFHIANNNGLSSSIYDLKDHKTLFPNISFKETISIVSTTLSALIQKENIDASKYQALIMDTQGSELLVLQGSHKILSNFSYIKTEVADFESYEGCCTLAQMEKFMQENGFKEHSRISFAQNDNIGKYYDIIYKKLS